MTQEPDKTDSRPEPNALDAFEELNRASQRGPWFARINQSFQEMLQSSRGSNRRHDVAAESAGKPHVTVDDIAMRRAKNVKAQRMVIPEGVIIEGSLTGGSETEICGRVDGDVIVDGVLFLGPSALVSGNVRATSCKVDGLVEGRMECSEDLDLSRTGRINADALAGRRMTLAGQVFGNVSTSGKLHLVSTGKITGDIRARSIVIEEGAVFNGKCAMRPPVSRAAEGDA
ncbi:MAG TPA: polymer-forming cytoskeletal protein [Candidatus Hydrogenedentes bacterium]|nr:polymer-forming cytoskeletal protein [Candidatus Hydrogenedentota bacterium]HOS03728.1 polymer-forming cytoskeletal protein [Candidatus Hydrogenedentota bacterium]